MTQGEEFYAKAQKKWSGEKEKVVENSKEEFDRICRKYDKYYHSLNGVAQNLIRSLKRKAENPKVNPKYLLAWSTYNNDVNNIVAMAVNLKNNHLWKRVNRESPFNVLFNKLKNDGFWLKSKLCHDGDLQYFEISVGFYVKPVEVTQ